MSPPIPFPSGLLRRAPPRDVPIIPHHPAPLRHGKPCLALLPADVLQRVLHFVREWNPDDILTVAAVCSSLYEHARYIQHGTLRISLKEREQARRRLDLVSRCAVLPAVRVLEVRGTPYSTTHRWGQQTTPSGKPPSVAELLRRLRREAVVVDPVEEANELVSRLGDMLRRGMTGLREIHWECILICDGCAPMPIPAAVLEGLGPHVRLHISVKCTHLSEAHTGAQEFLASLVKNPNLYSLSVDITHTKMEWCPPTMQVLREVISSCPNLRRIPMLDVHKIRYSCDNDGIELRFPYWSFGVSGQRPPPLEELRIVHYPFWCSWQRPPELEHWANVFDWSKLMTLEVGRNELGTLIAPKLTSLRELILHSSREGTAILDQIPASLQSLSVPGWRFASGHCEAILRHGEELRVLKMHGWPVSDTESPAITDRGLDRLRDGLPHLEQLEVELRRDHDGEKKSWPYAALDAIAKFRRLRTVEVWFDTFEGTPAVTASSVRHLLGYLRRRNRHIERLVVHAGVWSKRMDTMVRVYDANHDYWLRDNAITLICDRIHSDDDDDKDIACSVICPNLNRELNAQLNRHLQLRGTAGGGGGLIDLMKLDEKSLALKVALDGPIPEHAMFNWRYPRPQTRSEKLRRQVKATWWRRSR
ncbi:hypothetical protein F4778DRAFT_730441 [Xylariomycetidae sp. FL2044]|nr:hypothetical protein F4778DRAFT_730441 [Xylariomycetidae sp. FL2044]